uniref:Glycosyltransferase n=1 Tax=viral metagenome TaxID=1070528 RepID=A0A6C0KVP9_9ZZZZ
MDYSKICEELDKVYPHFINDGNCSQIPSQMESLKEIMKSCEPKNILEIGMGIGKCSLLFLCESDANVVSFDSCGDSYHEIGKKYIDSLFPNRHNLVIGDSSKTLDNFIVSSDIKFDIIFIDGGRDDLPSSDLSKCSFLSHENTIIIMNNYVRKSENYAFWNLGFNNAWNDFLSKKYIEEIDQFDYFWGRGMATGRYNFDKNGIPLCNIIDYKTMTKSEMFNEAKKMFINPKEKESKKLEEICELYLNYFEKIDDDESVQIQYCNAFLKRDSDKDNSILLFEKILKKGDKLDPNIKCQVETQLKLLYPKSEVDEIPKIIHLLYFGETEFRSYHYRCIRSILKNMPNHQIIIYNNVEPIGNAYWDSIKKYDSVKIEKIVPPSTFDGFELKHFQYKADVVRIEKLYEHGGIYLDIDMLIFKNFEKIFDSKHDFYISKEGSQGDGLINAFIASKPKNEFLKIWLESFKTGLRMSIWAYHIRDANAILLKDNPHFYLKYNINVLNSEEFFSIAWSNLNAFETMNYQTIWGENVYGIHLFETILHHTLICNPYFTINVDEEDVTENIVLEISDNHVIDNKICRINDLVDEVVVLSLKERPEKTQYISDHFNSLEIKHTIILNKLHWAPCIGCFEAHINAIRYAKSKGLKNVLICEDDASIVNIDAMNNLSCNLPPHWDIIYLGGILTNIIFSVGKFVRGTIWCNHAYIVNSNMYDIILEKFDNCNLADYANKKETIDHFYTNCIQEEYNCFLHIEQPIVQKEGYSDLSKKVKWGNFNWDTFSLKNLSDL